MQTHIKPVPSSTANQFEKAMAANDAAVASFNALPKSLENDDPTAFTQEEDRLLDGLRLADRAVPTTWSELERWVTHITNDGKADVERDNAVRLLAHVRRLLACSPPLPARPSGTLPWPPTSRPRRPCPSTIAPTRMTPRS